VRVDFENLAAEAAPVRESRPVAVARKVLVSIVDGSNPIEDRGRCLQK
jgi:hypothetical protein